MANVIKHKRGSGSDPTASDLVVGEVAIRTDVGKLFTKMDNGSVAEIAGGGSDIIINTLSASSSGSGASSFNSSENRFQLSSPPSVSAQQLLVSVNGVIQKPVPGTGTPSEGFSVDGNDIIFSSPPETGADFFILTFKSLGVSEPADNTVTSAKIVDGSIVNADINASAAIAGTKISPSFTSDIILTNANPSISLLDSDANSDFKINVNGGIFSIKDQTNVDATRLAIDSSGNVRIGSGTPATFGSGTTVLETHNANTFTANLVTSGTHQLQMIASQTHGVTSIGTRSNHNLHLCANDSTKVTITTAGNVGIGNSPGQKLDVSGNINTTGELRFDSATRRVFYRPGNNDMIFEAAANFFYMQDIANTAHKWFTNSGDVRFTIQADGKVGIATSSPQVQLDSGGASSNGLAGLTNSTFYTGYTNSGGFGGIVAGAGANGNSPFIAASKDGNGNALSLFFQTDGTERMRITSGGNIISTLTSPNPFNTIQNNLELVNGAGNQGAGSRIDFSCGSGKAHIQSQVTGGNSNSGLSLIFATSPDANGADERMRIDNNGRVLIGTTSITAHNDLGISLRPDVGILVGMNNTHAAIFSRHTSNGECVRFQKGTSDVGSIDVGASSTSYNTTSDYRLKENVVAISDGITRLKTLKPYRFNFISDASTIVDGFFAHEVTAVPEAITGTKDEVDSKDNPVYQKIDQSKLVPLLVAALQEAIGRIEVLEAK